MRLRLPTWALCATVGFLAGVSAPSASALTTVGANGNPPFLLAHGAAGPMDLGIGYEAATGMVVFAEVGISTTLASCTDSGDEVRCPLPPATNKAGETYIPGLTVTDHNGDSRVTMSATLPATLATQVRTGPGTDTITGGPGPDYLDGGLGTDTISGGAGFDFASYRQRNIGVTARIDGRRTSGNGEDGPAGARDLIATDVEGLDGGSVRDRLIGSSRANTLIGNKGDDVIKGGRGADRLLGGGGADKLYGERGRDYLDGEGLFDSLFGGPGIDLLRAKNHGPDRVIDCGPGNDRKEKVQGTDPGDPRPVSC